MKNVANCVADTDECRNMNPLTMLEDFWTTTGLKCHDKSEADEGDEGHAGFGAEQTNANPSNGDNRPSLNTAGIAIGLSVVGAIGLFGFYRARRRRERVTTRRDYEMTEISDLGFSVFT